MSSVYEDTVRNCVGCGSTIFPGATDCPVCGRLVIDKQEVEQEPRTTPVRQWPFRPDVGLFRYSLRATVVSGIGSGALISLALLTSALVGFELAGPPPMRTSLWTLFGGVIFAPLLETLLLAGLLHLLSLRLKRWPLVAAIAALLWGALHGTVAVAWFFGTVWSFFVFSAGYLAWRRSSFREAFVAAALPHAFLNLAALSMGYLMLP